MLFIGLIVTVVVPLVLIGGIVCFAGFVKRGGLDLKGDARYPWE
jgi:hypothetical protein